VIPTDAATRDVEETPPDEKTRDVEETFHNAPPGMTVEDWANWLKEDAAQYVEPPPPVSPSAPPGMTLEEWDNLFGDDATQHVEPSQPLSPIF